MVLFEEAFLDFVFAGFLQLERMSVWQRTGIVAGLVEEDKVDCIVGVAVGTAVADTAEIVVDVADTADIAVEFADTAAVELADFDIAVGFENADIEVDPELAVVEAASPAVLVATEPADFLCD